LWVHFTRTCQTTLHVPVRPLYTYLSDKTDKFKFIEWWSRKYHRKTITKTNVHGYVPLVVNTSRSFPHSWRITGFVTRLTRRVPLMEQELLTLAKYPSSPQVFSGVRVTRSLVLCVCFVDRCLSFCSFFSFGHCVVCSSNDGFWLHLWHHQSLLPNKALCRATGTHGTSISKDVIGETINNYLNDAYTCSFQRFCLLFWIAFTLQDKHKTLSVNT